MFKLLRFYSLFSAVVIVAVTVLIAVLIQQSTERNLVRSTERESADLMQAMLNATQDRIYRYLEFSSDKNPDVLRDSRELRTLSTEVHSLVHNMNVLKVKMYLLNGMTVFSSISTEIGKSKSGYPGFEQTLQTNRPTSQLTFRGQFSGFEKTVADRNLVASYLPLRGADGGMVGVLEFYSDVSEMAEDINAQNIQSLLIIGSVSGVLWIILLGIVTRGDMVMRAQYKTLELEIQERHAAQEELRHLASVDSLTGAFNRRHFSDLSQQEVRHAQRYRHNISALMIDLDKFKTVNDTHGHAAGDMVLKSVASAIQSSLRNTDIMGRLGGDEFSVVLVEADMKTAEAVAARIRTSINTLKCVYNGTEIPIRASIGGAHARQSESFDMLLSRADESLYEAKESGRDTVLFDQNQQADKLDM